MTSLLSCLSGSNYRAGYWAACFYLLLMLGVSTTSTRAATPASEGPRVMVSIRPVHSLVAALMQGLRAPDLLVDGADSPHQFALRPSHARALQQADLVVWIGPELEVFLGSALASLAGNARLLELAGLDGLHVLPARADASAHGAVAERDGHHQHHGHDPHLWLDPRNAQRFVLAIEQALIRIDAGHAALYRRNAQKLLQDLAALDRSVAARIKPLQGRRFVVLHDAYQYFEARYGLPSLARIMLSPTGMPGAARIRSIRNQLARDEAVCVFAEPQFDAAQVRAIIADGGVRSGVLDPIGSALPAGPGQYQAMMQALAGALAGCLAPGSAD